MLVVTEWGPLRSLDTRVADGLHRVAQAESGWTRANRVVSDWICDPWTMRALLAVVVVLLLRRGARSLAVWVACTALAGTVLQQLMKAAVGRPRPSWPDPVALAHYSAFPSGHALTVTVAGGLALWLLYLYAAASVRRRAVAAVVAVAIVCTAFSRVYLGVHWLTDVIAGCLLGAAVVTTAAGAYAYRTRAAVEGEGGSRRGSHRRSSGCA